MTPPFLVYPFSKSAARSEAKGDPERREPMGRWGGRVSVIKKQREIFLTKKWEKARKYKGFKEF